jgi:hypothetical protein
MGQNVSIFVGKMDVKYVRLQFNPGTKCHTVEPANNVLYGMFTCDFCPKKVFKTESWGRVDEQSVHLEIMSQWT